VLFAEGEASVGDILERLEDPPSYSAIRATLRVLEQKGHAEHIQDGPRYIYRPTVQPEAARSMALQQLVRTFFDGSAESAAAALLQMSDRLADSERDRITREIEKARRDGR
jgi:predicted transcriptional regulator